MQEPGPTTAGKWIRVKESAITGDTRATKVFLPRPLRSDLDLPSRVHRELARAEQWLGRLDEAARRLPDPTALIRATQTREVQSSAGLDNVYAALQEVLLVELHGSGAPSRIGPALSRYLCASNLAFAEVGAGEAIGVNLFVRISNQFSGFKDADADNNAEGLWRDQPGQVGGHRAGEAPLLTGPPGPHTRVALEQFATWNADECELPLVGKLALGHYQLEMLQPFSAGNGHLARLYIGLELVQARVLHGQILPISVWLDRHAEEYEQQIRRVVATGDFTEWIVFFSRGIRKTCRNQVRLINELEATRDDLLARLGGTGNIRKVFSSLVATPITNHNQIAQRQELSTKAATEITKRLIRAGLIQNMDNKNYRKVFVVPEFLRLLSLNDPPPPEHDKDVFAPDDPLGLPRA